MTYGIRNYADCSPIYIGSNKGKQGKNIKVLEFFSNGVPIEDWERKRSQLASKFNCKIAGIKGKDSNKILLYLRKNDVSEVLLWDDTYLSKKCFELVLGETPFGEVETVNLSDIPYILIRRTAQAHGKTVLLKLLLLQCLKKQALVYIADFKGGIDYKKVWHRKCVFVTEENKLLDVLSDIILIMEKRTEILKKAGCVNIDEYNQNVRTKLHRIIFAFDEVAEVLDKKGLSKGDKEFVSKVESKISRIARLGRAYRNSFDIEYPTP